MRVCLLFHVPMKSNSWSSNCVKLVEALARSMPIVLMQVSPRVGAQEMLPNGNELVRCAQFLIVAVGADGVPQQMILDMKKTQDESRNMVEYSSCWYEDYAP